MHTPGFILCRTVMTALEAVGTTSGSVDATNPQRIVIRFPVAGLGDPSDVARSACRMLVDVGIQPLTIDVNDRNATFTARDLAA